MNALFTPKRTRISTERYQRMVAAGVFTEYDRIELIEGDMIDMAPMGTKHVGITARLNEWFVLRVAGSATVVGGGPVNLGDYSEPQPDLMLLKHRADFYGGKLPEAADVLLLIEVSDSSLAFAQGVKRALYARYGIPDYWVVDVQGKRIVTHRDPGAAGYGHSREFTADDRVTPLAFPHLALTVREAVG